MTVTAIQGDGVNPLTPGMNLIATATASASATVEFIDGSSGVVFDSTYELYRLDMIGVVLATDARNFWLRLRDTTFQSDAGDYRWCGNWMHGISPTDQASTSSPQIDLTMHATSDRPGNGTGESINGSLYFPNPSSTALTCTMWGHVVYQATDNVETVGKIAGMYLTNQNAITGIQFLAESGNITSGEFKLYGVV